MVDITHKIVTKRTATAQAIVKVGSPETMQAILNKTVPKGDVLEVSRTAGLFAVKNTSSSIPDCHPMPIEYTGITFECLEDSVLIEVTVKTIYKRDNNIIRCYSQKEVNTENNRKDVFAK